MLSQNISSHVQNKHDLVPYTRSFGFFLKSPSSTPSFLNGYRPLVVGGGGGGGAAMNTGLVDIAKLKYLPSHFTDPIKGCIPLDWSLRERPNQAFLSREGYISRIYISKFLAVALDSVRSYELFSKSRKSLKNYQQYIAFVTVMRKHQARRFIVIDLEFINIWINQLAVHRYF